MIKGAASLMSPPRLCEVVWSCGHVIRYQQTAPRDHRGEDVRVCHVLSYCVESGLENNLPPSRSVRTAVSTLFLDGIPSRQPSRWPPKDWCQSAMLPVTPTRRQRRPVRESHPPFWGKAPHSPPCPTP